MSDLESARLRLNKARVRLLNERDKYKYTGSCMWDEAVKELEYAACAEKEECERSQADQRMLYRELKR